MLIVELNIEHVDRSAECRLSSSASAPAHERSSDSVYPRNKKGHGNFIKKGHFKRALSDQKGHSKRALIDQKGHINFAISVVA